MIGEMKERYRENGIKESKSEWKREGEWREERDMKRKRKHD